MERTERHVDVDPWYRLQLPARPLCAQVRLEEFRTSALFSRSLSIVLTTDLFWYCICRRRRAVFRRGRGRWFKVRRRRRARPGGTDLETTAEPASSYPALPIIMATKEKQVKFPFICRRGHWLRFLCFFVFSLFTSWKSFIDLCSSLSRSKPAILLKMVFALIAKEAAIADCMWRWLKLDSCFGFHLPSTWSSTISCLCHLQATHLAVSTVSK